MLWQTPKVFPLLQPNQVHIWRAQLKRNEKDFIGLLNSQEKLRASKFIAPQAKKNFIVARGILRQLLGKYLGVKPQDLLLHQNRYGKLYLDSSLQFNISHSQDLGLFAFTQHHAIGVDIEFIRTDFECVAIAQRFFSPTECSSLLALPADHQVAAFFHCWSRKEAFIKALGKGLFCELDSFSVEVSQKKFGRLQLHLNNNNSWSLEALCPASGFVGAFATPYCNYETSFYQL